MLTKYAYTNMDQRTYTGASTFERANRHTATYASDTTNRHRATKATDTTKRHRATNATDTTNRHRAAKATDTTNRHIATYATDTKFKEHECKKNTQTKKQIPTQTHYVNTTNEEMDHTRTKK